MERKIIFAEGCMRGCRDVDNQVMKEKVINIINKAEDYIANIEDCDSGKIADKQQQIFVKFFVVGNRLIVDQVQEHVYVC